MQEPDLLGVRVWALRFDADESVAKLAAEVWDARAALDGSLDLQAGGHFETVLLALLGHHGEGVRLAAARALAAGVARHHPQVFAAVAERVKAFYAEDLPAPSRAEEKRSLAPSSSSTSSASSLSLMGGGVRAKGMQEDRHVGRRLAGAECVRAMGEERAAGSRDEVRSSDDDIAPSLITIINAC